jgi:hypothetical protein
MRYFDQPFSSSSPVLVLPPHLPPQPSFNMDSNRPHFTSPFTNGIHQSPVNSSWSTPTPTSATPASAAGRKRSRDEAGPNLEDDYFPVQPPVVRPEPENEEEWEYGEGMVLIKPNRKGGIIEAGSQTGTWAEEQAEQERVKAAAAALAAATPERPILRAAKSQRLHLSSTPCISEEVMSNGTFVSPGSPERTNGHAEPTVDDFTRHLGIGWSSVNTTDADVGAAARGWTKFIENHFPITDAKIRLQSKGLASYLVEANEGYFLFGEDLKQGRLVSTSLENTWVNLRAPVPVFEGDVVMEASSTPKIDAGTQPMANGEMVMNGTNGHAMNNDVQPVVNGGHMVNGIGGFAPNEGQSLPGHTLEVEMDMS